MKTRFGKAFFEQFKKTDIKNGHFHKFTVNNAASAWQENLITGIHQITETPLLGGWKKAIFPLIVMIIFSLILTKLFQLQVVEGKINRELADSNRIKVKLIHAPRGVIYDRNGKILAQNEPSFRLINEEADEVQISYLSREEALNLEINKDPKFNHLEIDTTRTYPLGEVTAHVLGYISEISGEELKMPQYKNYRLGDRIGRSGIEESYEKILRGVDGGEIYEIDASGEKLRTIRKTEPIPGQNLHLSIDIDLQKNIYENLKKGIQDTQTCCGAAVAENPHSGEILALVSLPTFNPADITQGLQAQHSPILNRVIGGIYPPGSTFKIASALAGLDSGKINSTTQFEDKGQVDLGPYKLTNWYYTQYGKTEGLVDLIKALKRSNDTFFYYLGIETNEKIIGEAARKLGLGKKLGIDIPGEVDGLIPDNNWKIKSQGVLWYPGDTLHMAIGQGFVLTTPLQISSLISIIAADGKQYPPHLAKKITDSQNRLVKEFKYDELAIPFNKKDITLVKQGLEEVVKSGGTAWPFFTFPVKTAGKTGTAEFGDPKGKTHAWYTSYAPVDNTQIALTVLVESGGEGSSVAGSVSKEIYRWYFSNDKTDLIKDTVPIIASESARILGE